MFLKEAFNFESGIVRFSVHSTHIEVLEDEAWVPAREGFSLYDAILRDIMEKYDARCEFSESRVKDTMNDYRLTDEFCDYIITYDIEDTDSIRTLCNICDDFDRYGERFWDQLGFIVTEN